MAQAGFTPLQLYYSTTASTLPLAGNLIPGELALNIADGKLFFKNSSGVVTKLADSATATGSVTGGTAGALVYQSSPNNSTFLNIGANGYIVTSTGTVPTYTNPASITVGNATAAVTSTNLAGGAAFRIPYQASSGVTNFLTAPTITGYVLGWTGSAIDWVAAPAASSSINLTGGTAGAVPYQAGVGSTLFTGVGTAGQVLVSNGTAAPTWNTLDALPSQTGNAGKYLTTDGTNASWQFTGASAAGVIWENSLVIASNYTLTAGKNGMSVGPITINSGVVVTVPSGQRWVVL
jgi:hypothetical protein